LGKEYLYNESREHQYSHTIHDTHAKSA
jgi:hypothetical protein